MAKFKDKQSGTVVEFFTEYDDLQMRSHPDYEEVIEPVPKVTKTKPEPVAE